jgi:Helix-turn-helix domain
MGSKNLDERKDRYFQLHHYMLKTDAWKGLSAPARAVYVQIGSRYNGSNNGRLSCSVRDAATECNLAKNTAGKAFKELIDLGFIEETRHGSLSRKTRVASEWRLTAFKCDLSGNLKTCLFMQRGSQARDNRQSHGRPQRDRSPVSNDAQSTT